MPFEFFTNRKAAKERKRILDESAFGGALNLRHRVLRKKRGWIVNIETKKRNY